VIRVLCENLVQGILKTSINLVGIFNLVMIIRCTETGEIRRHLWKVVYSTQKLVAEMFGFRILCVYR